jgi:NAD(P)-dependent dehydrogenase (short-subunit alcohol dehydrogenase family)
MAYPASKAAVNMIIVRYAHAFPKIRINAAEPGHIATDPNLHQGMQAAEIIVPMAQSRPGRPTGVCSGASGPLPWQAAKVTGSGPAWPCR